MAALDELIRCAGDRFSGGTTRQLRALIEAILAEESAVVAAIQHSFRCFRIEPISSGCLKLLHSQQTVLDKAVDQVERAGSAQGVVDVRGIELKRQLAYLAQFIGPGIIISFGARLECILE